MKRVGFSSLVALVRASSVVTSVAVRNFTREPVTPGALPVRWSLAERTALGVRSIILAVIGPQHG